MSEMELERQRLMAPSIEKEVPPLPSRNRRAVSAALQSLVSTALRLAH